MATPAPRTDMSLKGLELFQICARKGSLQAAAHETGLSVSTVSHHLRRLEDHLGIALFDHTRRPLVLTQKGQAFLRNIDAPLRSIRMARAQATAGEAGFLRIGTIGDLETDVTPALAVHLSAKLPHCDFSYHTASSREIFEMLQARELDIGVTAMPPERGDDLQIHPLLRDPFMIVLPAQSGFDLSEVVQGGSDLPFLQFSRHLIIAGQIEAQLRRLGLSLPHKFECASNQTLMAMVAAGAGWTITTPLLFSRASRFRPDLQAHPFPAQKFARTLCLNATADCAQATVDMVRLKLRAALSEQIIEPMHANHPWIENDFRLLN